MAHQHHRPVQHPRLGAVWQTVVQVAPTIPFCSTRSSAKRWTCASSHRQTIRANGRARTSRTGSKPPWANPYTSRRAGMTSVASPTPFSNRVPIIPKRPLRNNRKRTKKIQALVNDLKTAHPDRSVEVWFQDEARLGTKSVLRRCLAKRGVRPTAPHANGFEWTYIYGFVHPFSGRTDLLRFACGPISLRSVPP